MSIRALLTVRPAGGALPAAVLLALAGCAGPGTLPADSVGQLFARSLDEIAELYIEPVANRRLAVAGAAQLSKLDGDLAVTDNGAMTLTYSGRTVAAFAMPGEANRYEWGALLASDIASARQASPRLAALPEDTVEKAVFDGMTGALDRFSHYAMPQVARDQRAARDGFGGIGVTIDIASDRFQVSGVAPHSPAERAGIHPEDQIVAIDGVTTSGRSQDEVLHQLRGPVGSTIALSVLHPGMMRPHDLQLHRAFVTVPTVTASRDGDVAVFRIASFNHSTAQRIAETLAELQRESARPLGGIVLDLRGNPGGLLDQAVGLADLFVPHGPISSTVGRHPASRQYFAASGGSIAPRLPLVVLINGGSASAAEIVAAALQDLGRAVVIGSSSYGKGSVQTVVRLPNDGELTLTWARLLTPAGYYLQSHGVVPTVCTAGLGDDARSLEVGLQRAAVTASGGSGLRPRAGLDEAGWVELRRLCPPRRSSPELDVKLAERLLADPQLYGEALHALPATAQLAASPPERDLTGTGGALSSP